MVADYRPGRSKPFNSRNPPISTTVSSSNQHPVVILLISVLLLLLVNHHIILLHLLIPLQHLLHLVSHVLVLDDPLGLLDGLVEVFVASFDVLLLDVADRLAVRAVDDFGGWNWRLGSVWMELMGGVGGIWGTYEALFWGAKNEFEW